MACTGRRLLPRTLLAAAGTTGMVSTLVLAGAAEYPAGTSIAPSDAGPVRNLADEWNLVQPGTTGTTLIILGGASDPTSSQQAGRVLRPTDDRVVTVNQPGIVGIGGDGLPEIGYNGTSLVAGTYQQTVQTSAADTLDAITASGTGPVYVYAISQGSDAASVAAQDYDADPTSSTPVTFVEYGSPSFPETGVWQDVPAGIIPGLPAYGPVQTTDLDHAEVTSVCAAGDAACGSGDWFVDPVSSLFYLIPGAYIHSTWYTYENLEPYAAASPNAPIAPDSTETVSGPTPVGAPTYQTRPDGTVVTVQQYSDGSSTETWTDGSTTYLVIDSAQNPWGYMLRGLGVPVPTQFDQVLNTLVPVAQPGQPTYVDVAGITPVAIPTPFQLQDTLAPWSVAAQPGATGSPATAAVTPAVAAAPSVLVPSSVAASSVASGTAGTRSPLARLAAVAQTVTGAQAHTGSGSQSGGAEPSATSGRSTGHASVTVGGNIAGAVAGALDSAASGGALGSESTGSESTGSGSHPSVSGEGGGAGVP